MSDSTAIHGTCHPKFEGVRDVFLRSFESGAEVGAAVCLTVGGETVVDLWAGFRDAERRLPWERDTLVNVFSTTKGITALAAHQLIDEGRLDLDAPVARYWPEFAAAGKEQLPVRYLLTHEAGLAAIRKPLDVEAQFDWDTMTTALAEQAPWWTPGSEHGYHALTFGWLVGEVVRRITGQSLGATVRERISDPLGVEFSIGCPEALDPRVAELVPGPIAAPADGAPAFDMVREIRNNPEGLFAKAFANPRPRGLPHVMGNDPAWRRAEIPAANGHTNAHSLARIYSALALGGEIDGVRLLSREGVDLARTEQVYGPDLILPVPSRLGLGFFLPTREEPLCENPRAFGHAGAGGSYGHADPEAQLGFGYVMNSMHQGAWLVDPRPRALLAAAYAAL